MVMWSVCIDSLSSRRTKSRFLASLGMTLWGVMTLWKLFFNRITIRMEVVVQSDHNTEKPPLSNENGGFLIKSRQRSTLPPGRPGSTIDAEGLNCRVRNGNGCFPLAIATGNLWRLSQKRRKSKSFASLGMTCSCRPLLRRDQFADNFILETFSQQP